MYFEQRRLIREYRSKRSHKSYSNFTLSAKSKLCLYSSSAFTDKEGSYEPYNESKQAIEQMQYSEKKPK